MLNHQLSKKFKRIEYDKFYHLINSTISKSGENIKLLTEF
jgi:hypothetical protein